MPQLRNIAPHASSGAPTITPVELQAMKRAVINLFSKWNLTDAQAAVLLGGINVRTYQRWKSEAVDASYSPDLAARLSNILGIHKALRLLFRDKQRAYGWIKRPNSDLTDRSALEVMLDGQLTDLMRVRRYLDAQRGPW